MRFLWKGYPKPIAASEESRNGCMRKILLPGEKFSVAASLSEAPKGGFSESDFAPKRVEGAYLAADSSGEVYASFGPRKVKILSDGVSELGPSFHSILSFGKDGTKIVKMGGMHIGRRGRH